MEVDGVEHIQQEVVGVVRNDERGGKRDGRGHHVDMDVLEPVGPGIGMGNHGRNDDDVPLAVVQTPVIELEGA